MSKQSDLVSVSQGASGDPLFIDTANNRVGVGTSSPDTILNIGFTGADDINTFRIEGSNGSSERYALDIVADGGNSVSKFMIGQGGGSPVERMRIDASGNVGIGTSSPAAKLHVAGGTGSTIRNTASAGSSWFVGSNVDAYILHNESNTPMVLTTNGTERMRIASNGYVGFDVTSPTSRIHLNGGTPSVSNSGIAAAWNVHSDYRLKENVVEFSGASSLVSQLHPVKFSWVGEDKSEATTAGFIAHEMAEVAPYSVIGEKDAVNEDGSIKSQAADYSKLVPLLTAALQEALQKIDALETRISALETN